MKWKAVGVLGGKKLSLMFMQPFSKERTHVKPYTEVLMWIQLKKNV